MDQIYAELLKIPPVTRTLLLSTLGVTLPCLLHLLSPYKILFVPELVLGGEVWRVPTSFLYGGAGITFLFDLMTLYRNSTALEEGQYSGKSYDYCWHLLLACFALLGINLPLSSYLHAHSLLLTLVTLLSRLTPDQTISLMGLLQLPLKYLPYAMLGMDAVMAGPLEAGRGLTGVIVGLGWAMLLERGTAPAAPEIVKRWVGSGIRVGVGAGGSGVVNPGRAGGAGFGAGAAGGGRGREVPASTGGHTWGTGRRLGD
ncbi:DER1-domain-containing protein [Calocera cornea HHB12733]|uniref:Derlin n=1 Tax=Calocera cornea HHB12733 TaxID=1353952 RepID=A0A165CPB0_9BASI|nr:DER1-domain-containing protein [Calocera cornea HHB12733]